MKPTKINFVHPLYRHKPRFLGYSREQEFWFRYQDWLNGMADRESCVWDAERDWTESERHWDPKPDPYKEDPHEFAYWHSDSL